MKNVILPALRSRMVKTGLVVAAVMSLVIGFNTPSADAANSTWHSCTAGGKTVWLRIVYTNYPKTSTTKAMRKITSTRSYSNSTFTPYRPFGIELKAYKIVGTKRPFLGSVGLGAITNVYTATSPKKYPWSLPKRVNGTTEVRATATYAATGEQCTIPKWVF